MDINICSHYGLQGEIPTLYTATGNEDLKYIKKLCHITCILAKTAIAGNSME